MLCKNCMKEHNDADKFCPFCGRPVQTAPEYERTKMYVRREKPKKPPEPENGVDKAKPEEPEPVTQQRLTVSWHDEGAEELIDDEERYEIKKENRRFLIIECVLLTLVLCLAAAIFITLKNQADPYDTYTMDGLSMEPTIMSGDKLSVEKTEGTPKCGDIVVISWGEDNVYIKRVIAVGGQTLWLDYDGDRIVVDGEELSEPYIKGSTYSGVTENYLVPYNMPEGKVFVMGDNRGESIDSRSSEIGLIDEKDIIGRVVKINGEDVTVPAVKSQEETK